jgi:hypothetical protein
MSNTTPDGPPTNDKDALTDADILREIGMDEAADDLDDNLNGTF